jgi:hypothetical protein
VRAPNFSPSGTEECSSGTTIHKISRINNHSIVVCIAVVGRFLCCSTCFWYARWFYATLRVVKSQCLAPTAKSLYRDLRPVAGWREPRAYYYLAALRLCLWSNSKQQSTARRALYFGVKRNQSLLHQTAENSSHGIRITYIFDLSCGLC